MAKETNPPADDAQADDLRAEFDGLHAKFAASMTDMTADPKDTRKAGPPLTPAESKRLHALHSLLA